jgi:ketosteroid isomerase-like protein
MKAGADIVKTKAHSTLVFIKVGDDWKITHEHFSPFKPNP